MWPALEDAAADKARAEPPPWAYALYHKQAVAGALEGVGLWIAFGAFEGSELLAAGRTIQRVLEDAGLEVEWDGDLGMRLHVQMEWRRRSPV